MRSRNNCMIRLRLRNTSCRTCTSSNQPQTKSLSARRPIESQPEGAENETGILTSIRPWDQSLPPRSSCSGTLHRCIVQGTNRLRSRRRESTWCRSCRGRIRIEDEDERGGRERQPWKSMRMMRGSDDRPGLTSIRPESA